MKRDPAVTSKIMSRIRSKDTKPELAMGKALSELWLYFRRQVDAPGKPDFGIKKYKVAIFVDGDFWHGNTWRRKGLSSFEEELAGYAPFWQDKIRANVERDKRVNRELKKAGWKVFRFWAVDVVTDPSKCAEKIRVYMDGVRK